MSATSSEVSSLCCTSVTTAAAPHALSSSRSEPRSRARLPGHGVMAITASPSSGTRTSNLSRGGCDGCERERRRPLRPPIMDTVPARRTSPLEPPLSVSVGGDVGVAGGGTTYWMSGPAAAASGSAAARLRRRRARASARTAAPSGGAASDSSPPPSPSPSPPTRNDCSGSDGGSRYVQSLGTSHSVADGAVATSRREQPRAAAAHRVARSGRVARLVRGHRRTRFRTPAVDAPSSCAARTSSSLAAVDAAPVPPLAPASRCISTSWRGVKESGRRKAGGSFTRSYRYVLLRIAASHPAKPRAHASASCTSMKRTDVSGAKAMPKRR